MKLGPELGESLGYESIEALSVVLLYYNPPRTVSQEARVFIKRYIYQEKLRAIETFRWLTCESKFDSKTRQRNRWTYHISNEPPYLRREGWSMHRDNNIAILSRPVDRHVVVVVKSVEEALMYGVESVPR